MDKAEIDASFHLPIQIVFGGQIFQGDCGEQPVEKVKIGGLPKPRYDRKNVVERDASGRMIHSARLLNPPVW